MKVFMIGKVFFSECLNFSQNSKRKVSWIFSMIQAKILNYLISYMSMFITECVRVKE